MAFRVTIYNRKTRTPLELWTIDARKHILDDPDNWVQTLEECDSDVEAQKEVKEKQETKKSQDKLKFEAPKTAKKPVLQDIPEKLIV